MIRNNKVITSNNIKKVIYLSIISIILIIITNIISYNYLPDYVALKSNGSNRVEKELFVTLFPLISLITNFINLKLNNRSLLNSILLNIILPILNL